jgi:hypothetical protein
MLAKSQLSPCDLLALAMYDAGSFTGGWGSGNRLAGIWPDQHGVTGTQPFFKMGGKP